MLSIFQELGGTEAEFWTLTPRRYYARMEAEAARMKRESDNRTEHAWLIAALSRVRDFPSLNSLLRRKTTRPLTDEEVTAHLRAMAGARPKKKWSEWQAQ